jgi:hypothetical protein
MLIKMKISEQIIDDSSTAFYYVLKDVEEPIFIIIKRRLKAIFISRYTKNITL